MFRVAIATLWLSALLGITGCSPTTAPSENAPSNPGETAPDLQPTAEPRAQRQRTFQVRGVIKEIPETGTSLRIQHEEIPDYMNAMTMPFTVKTRDEFSGFKVGDSVSFTLHVTDTESWIDHLQAAQSGLAPGEIPSLSSFRQVRDVEPLSAGDSLPNYAFVNQDGQDFDLDSFRGQVLVITFIYTRCPLPDFCPRMSLHFRAALQALGQDEEAPKNWHFLSLSFDPAHDTPERLKQYAAAYSNNSERWSFATGKIVDIDAITEQFGLAFSRSQVSVVDWDHNLRTVVIRPDGRIHQIYIGNTWSPETLVRDIKDASTASLGGADEPPSPATTVE